MLYYEATIGTAVFEGDSLKSLQTKIADYYAEDGSAATPQVDAVTLHGVDEDGDTLKEMSYAWVKTFNADLEDVFAETIEIMRSPSIAEENRTY